MRPFRVWDKDEQKMYYDGFCIEPDGSLVWLNDAKPEPDSYVLMQSTGLKDKSGKEVYEGDIVEAEECRISPKTDEVVFESGCFRLKHWWLLKGYKSLKVIGTVHSHPELLK